MYGRMQRWNPFAPPAWDGPLSLLRRATADMERMFEGFPAEIFPKEESKAVKELRWTPSIDVIEKDDVLTIRVDLPGITKDEVKIAVTGDVLTVQGERKKEEQEGKGGQYRIERAYGSFFRAVPLPDGVKAEDVKATFTNGVLEVTVPLPAKVTAPPSREVPIQDAAIQEKAKAAVA